MNIRDLETFRPTPADRRRRQRLAERICDSIGANPRPLPSRLELAIERAARPLTVVACAVTIVMLAVGALTRPAIPEPASSLLASALEGKLPAARDVYAEMSGIIAGWETAR